MMSINCIFNDRGCWCKNKKTKRAFVFFGARMCKLFTDTANKCTYKVKIKRPIVPPPMPR